jgi:2-dehydro-3-deoxy-D-arabinonate dehydratase
MRLYKIKKGALLEKNASWYMIQGKEWDELINDDSLFYKLNAISATATPVEDGADIATAECMAPVQSQEVWASGVTYYNSKLARQEESKGAGGGEFYARVYNADRPELFFKATPNRVVGHRGKVNIRKDSAWDVPEPELTLVITSTGKIIGYTIGNDMSSRSIEGENPLYLPQAKTYDACAAIGPCIYVTEDALPSNTQIQLEISRHGNKVFEGKIAIDQIKRQFTELVGYLFRECSFPHGCLLMTGTGIVPTSEFTLQKDDEIRITIDNIGTLVNTVA